MTGPDLLTFSGKVERGAQWSRGLFVSYSGFSDDGLQAFALGRRTSIVCMDGLDLAHVLAGGLNFIDVIQRKNAALLKREKRLFRCVTYSPPLPDRLAGPCADRARCFQMMAA